MEKNSFSLLETVLSLIILSILVSGFSQFTYLKNDPTVSFNSIQNLLKIPSSYSHIHTLSLGYQHEDSSITFTQGNTLIKTIYDDGNFKLERYTLKEKKAQIIEFKVFE